MIFICFIILVHPHNVLLLLLLMPYALPVCPVRHNYNYTALLMLLYNVLLYTATHASVANSTLTWSHAVSTHFPVLDLPSQFRKALSWGAYITLVIAPGSARSRTLLLYNSLLTLILLPIGITLPQSIIIMQQANAGN